MQNLKRIIFISCFLLSNYVISGACDDYEDGHYEIHIKEGSDGRFKITATAEEAIRFDGVAGIVEALKIAEEKAILFIAEFVEVEIIRTCRDIAITSKTPANALAKNLCEITKKIPDDVVTWVMKEATKVDMCVQDLEYPRMVIVTVGISSSYSKL